MPNDLNLPNWVVSGLEKRCEVIIKEQRENNFRQIAEACLVVDIEHLDYNQDRNISCNDRVIIHKLKAQSSKLKGIGNENSCCKCSDKMQIFL